jgi:hypothetical protein
VPKLLIDRKGRNKVKVTTTVAFSPETARTLKAGYCKSHLRTKICKISQDGELVDISADETDESVKDRYATVVRCDKTFSSHVTAGEWAVLVEQQSRWRPRSHLTPFAIVITVSDPRRQEGIDIYSAVRAEVPNKYRNELTVREKIRV